MKDLPIWVNGCRLPLKSSTEIHHGDIIVFGSFHQTFQLFSEVEEESDYDSSSKSKRKQATIDLAHVHSQVFFLLIYVFETLI